MRWPALRSRRGRSGKRSERNRGSRGFHGLFDTAGKRGSESVSQRLTGAHNYLEEDFFAGAKDPADLTRTIRTYSASDLYENLEARRSRIREFANERCSRIKGGEILDGV